MSIAEDIQVNHGEYLPVASILKHEKALVFERIPLRHIHMSGKWAFTLAYPS